MFGETLICCNKVSNPIFRRRHTPFAGGKHQRVPRHESIQEDWHAPGDHRAVTGILQAIQQETVAPTEGGQVSLGLLISNFVRVFVRCGPSVRGMCFGLCRDHQCVR